MSKRIIALLLALVMVFALCACGNGGNGGNSAGTEDVGDETYTIRIACENSDSYPQLSVCIRWRSTLSPTPTARFR